MVFLLTTGDVLDDDQQAAFEAWIAAGGGYMGVHSAADTEYGWPFYGALMGAYFKAHPAVQAASVDIEVADHPAMAGLTSPWMHTDEWYDFQTNPRGVGHRARHGRREQLHGRHDGPGSSDRLGARDVGRRPRALHGDGPHRRRAMPIPRSGST